MHAEILVEDQSSAETDEQWASLRSLLGEPSWARHSQFNTAAGRWAGRAELDGQLTSWTGRQDAYELMERCQQAGVPAGVVQTGADLTSMDPQLKHNGMFFDYADPHPLHGPIKGDRLALRFSKTPTSRYERPEVFGESNESVAADWLRMPAEKVARLESEGIME